MRRVKMGKEIYFILLNFAVCALCFSLSGWEGQGFSVADVPNARPYSGLFFLYGLHRAYVGLTRLSELVLLITTKGEETTETEE